MLVCKMKNFLFVDSAVYANMLERDLALKFYGIAYRKLPDEERKNFSCNIKPSHTGKAKSEIFGLYLDPSAILEAAGNYGTPLKRADIDYAMRSIAEGYKTSGREVKAVRSFMEGYDGTRIMIGTYPKELMERLLPVDMGYFDHYLLNSMIYDGDDSAGISSDINPETQSGAMRKFLNRNGVTFSDGKYRKVDYIGSDPFCGRIAEHHLDPSNGNIHEALKDYRSHSGNPRKPIFFPYLLSRAR